MKCPNERELQRFSDGELRGRKKSRVAEHVERCELCAKEVLGLRRVGELVSGAIRKETEGHELAGLWERVRAGIAAQERAPGKEARVWEVVLRFLWKPAAKVAYAALVLLLGGFLAVKVFLPGEHAVAIAHAEVNSVASYSPEVAVSVVVAYGDNSEVVWITGLDATKEN
jgi:anti-sigma factor RsiW